MYIVNTRLTQNREKYSNLSTFKTFNKTYYSQSLWFHLVNIEIVVVVLLSTAVLPSVYLAVPGVLLVLQPEAVELLQH